MATIQWLGYDTPEGATALGQGAAEPGARDLPGFVDGIRVQRHERLHWTVVGHSYGSLVAGKALSEQGLSVDEVVFVGSPGVGVNTAAELGEGFNVWVGLAAQRPVGYSEWFGPNPHEGVRRHALPHGRHLRPLELLQRGLGVAAQHRPDHRGVPR